MNDDPVEVIRELCDALNANDDTERMSRMTHPDVVQYGTRGGIDQGRVVRGRDAVQRYWGEIREAWESLRFEPEQLIERDDVVVAFWRETARSRHSDLEVESQTATVFRLRDGMIVEIRGYLDRDEALRAAGVAEQGGGATDT
jgi:ketosteroid isomerase-like protein